MAEEAAAERSVLERLRKSLDAKETGLEAKKHAAAVGETALLAADNAMYLDLPATRAPLCV